MNIHRIRLQMFWEMFTIAKSEIKRCAWVITKNKWKHAVICWEGKLEQKENIQMELIFFSFIYISWRLTTLQYCSSFWHTLTWISHGFTCVPHPDPPPTSLLIPTLWVILVPQPWTLVSCIQPGLAICFTSDNIHVSMLFSQIIPPSPSPTESKSLLYTSVTPFLSCI